MADGRLIRTMSMRVVCAMTNQIHEVAGVYRDLTQARLGLKAARRRGMETTEDADIVQDTDGFHVRVRTSGSTDAARQLLLEYGAYSATVAC